MAQTAIEYLLSNLPERFKNAVLNSCKDLINESKAMERDQIAKAMMYALDEDGHTGEWKNRFIKDYIERI